MLDVEALLEPRSADEPSGADLEYDEAFTALMLAAQPGEERQVGASVIPAEDPDWGEVIGKAVAVLERSHDIRAAIHLANAELALRGIPGLTKVLAYVRGCLERHWDTFYPRLDAEDDDDPTARVNAIIGLADQQNALMRLRNAPITNSKLVGRFSLRDVLIATNELPAPAGAGDPPDLGKIANAFEDTDPAWRTDLVAAAREARDQVKAIVAICDERLGASGPDLSALQRMTYQIAKHVEEMAGADAEEAAVEEASDAEDDAGGADPAQPRAPARAAAVAAPGTIASREDVLKTIDRICEYYAKNEPSSPVPLILNRAKRLVTADFLAILKDIAPDGVSQVVRLGGITDDE